MPSSSHQLALKTLLFGIEVVPELTADAQRVAFLQAMPHDDLQRFKEIIDCHQSFKPRAVRLEEAGFNIKEQLEGPYDVVLLLPERQREEVLADFARAFELLREGGVLIVGMHNDWGAKRFETYLKEAFQGVQTITKFHCRVFWVTKPKKLPADTLRRWTEEGALQRVLDGKFWSKPGLFSWNHIDAGSKYLTEFLPESIAGTVADLGAGWGFLSQHLLQHFPDIRVLDAYEADRDGVEATRRNMGNVKVAARARALWWDVTAGIEPRHYDYIVMNPPFHDGREPTPELGMKFLAAAARGLRSDGQVWLVANRHLPYEELLDEVFDSVVMVNQNDNYKVINASFPKHELFFQRGKRKGR